MFCPDCDGVGRIPERREDVYCDPEHECAFCHGTGIVLRDHK
jgi:DnaJ-class molecular chaperone